MDNYIPPMSSLSPTQWEENSDLYQRTFWLDASEPLADGFLLDSGGNLNLEESTLPSENHVIYELGPQQIASKDLSVPQKQESNVSEGSFPLLSGPLGEEFNGSCTSESAPCALIKPVSLNTDDLDASVYPPSVEGSNQLPATQHFWASPLSSGNMEDFGFQEQLVGIESSDLGNASVEYDKLGEIQGFSRIFKVEEHDGLQSINLPDISHGLVAESAHGFSFEVPQQLQPLPLPLPPVDLYPTENFQNQPLANVSQPAPANNMRTRVRARRGQATDPHSIAERLRREKISERMKNLRELVPNASKTDKASMLEEIVDYVKFLQLQVKVLSMSRLGAAHAIAPLVTDIPSKEKSGDTLVADNHEKEYEREESRDTVEAEKEVMSLLESNVSMAMQLLQTKGLCLMPVALAAAIAAFKGSAAAPVDRSKAQLTDTTALPVRRCICHAKEENPGENKDNKYNGNVRESRPKS